MIWACKWTKRKHAYRCMNTHICSRKTGNNQLIINQTEMAFYVLVIEKKLLIDVQLSKLNNPHIGGVCKHPLNYACKPTKYKIYWKDIFFTLPKKNGLFSLCKVLIKVQTIVEGFN